MKQITIIVQDKTAATIIGLVADYASEIHMTNVPDLRQSTKEPLKVPKNTVKNLTANTRSGKLILNSLTLHATATREDLQKILEDAGFKARSWSPLVTQLVAEGYLERVPVNQGEMPKVKRIQ